MIDTDKGHHVVTIDVNGMRRAASVEARKLLVHLLRDDLGLTGTHVGCDTSQCGACTVDIDGQAVKSCTVLAVMADGSRVTTIEGLAPGGALHPMQRSFIEHDAFQCGYCTPGQIVSAVGMLEEAEAGWPSHVTRDVSAGEMPLTDEEIRERMSGNLCRCGAYNGIVDAVTRVFFEEETAR